MSSTLCLQKKQVQSDKLNYSMAHCESVGSMVTLVRRLRERQTITKAGVQIPSNATRLTISCRAAPNVNFFAELEL